MGSSGPSISRIFPLSIPKRGSSRAVLSSAVCVVIVIVCRSMCEPDPPQQILVVDPARARIILTAKRTLVDSEHPIVTKPEDAKVGLVTHAVVCKVSEKHLQVEFYNGTKGIVLHREAR